MVLLASAVCLLNLFFLISAEDNSRLKFGFWSRMTLGQVVSSTREPGYDIPFDKEWLETIDGGIKVNYKLTPYLTGRLNLGVVINLATVSPREMRTFEYSAKKVAPALLDACLEYQRKGVLFDNDQLLVELGYFPFKYNQQSTNLGEYLFRSGTYPGWLITGFEHSIDRPKLAGVHASYTVGSTVSLKQDLIMNTELDVFPYRDIHLSYIATPSFGKFLNLGIGVQFARLIALDHRKTTLGTDPFYKDRFEPIVGYIDTASGDTIRYTFKGTKAMGRAMFDVKELLELLGFGSRIFGKEDLKIYGEMALLGVKNYKGWYEKPNERIPMMVGFNFPAFKILDVLSVEVQRYKTPYINTQDYIWKASSAIPYVPGRVSPMDYDREWNDSTMAVTDDDIRWSIYASKQLGKHIRLSAQAACDHTPKNWYTPWPAPQSAKYSDIVPKNDDWYFMMRMSFYF